MPTRLVTIIASLLIALLTFGGIHAQDGGETVPYVQARGFNVPVPVLGGWEDQSTEDIAQYHFAEAKATIRTALVVAQDPLAAARSELADILGATVGEPVYSGKVNLADGTWQALVFDIDAATSASVMARRIEAQVVVISFVERDESNRILMLTMAQEGESRDHALTELLAATDMLMSPLLGELGRISDITLPSGTWVIYPGAGHIRMGMAYGNDSFLALAKGPIGANLAPLAEAYYTTVLGFFVTPDNSAYLALGLVVTFTILGILIFSYFWRARTIGKDLAMLSALAQENLRRAHPPAMLIRAH